MKIAQSDLQTFEEPKQSRGTLFDIGIGDLGNESTPVTVTYEIHPKGQDYLLTGTVQTDLLLICDRCLGAARLAVEGSLEVWLCTEERVDLDKEEQDVILLHPGEMGIDISRQVADSIYLAVCQKILCRDDCRGLCPICGVNSNTTQCDCQTDEIDERWAALAEIKQKLKK